MADFDFPACQEVETGMPFQSLSGNTTKPRSSIAGKGFSDSATTTPIDDKENKTIPNLPYSRHSEPATPAIVKPIRVIQSSRPRDDLPSMLDLVEWRNPAASLCALLFGSAVCAVAQWVFRGTTPFLSGATSFLAVLLTINFFRGTLSASWLKESIWAGSEFEELLLSRSKDMVAFLVLTRDEFLCSQDPWVMLRTCLALACVRTLSFHVSFWMMMLLGWVGVFVLFPFSTTVGHIARKAVASTTKLQEVAVQQLRLDRLSKICWAVIAGLVAAIVSDTTSRGFLALAVLIFVRCSMKREEVTAMQKNPVVQSVANSELLRSAFKVTTQMGSFADDVLMSAMKSARRHIGSDHEE